MSRSNSSRSNPEMIAALARLGIQAESLPGKLAFQEIHRSSGKGIGKITTTLGALSRFQESISSLPWAKHGNGFRAAGYFGEHEDEWRGGSAKQLMADLRGDIDMRPFQDALAAFKGSDIGKRLSSVFEDRTPRRRRINSEHDGEWDFDRKWEIQPYRATKREMAPVKVMDIICHFAISAGASADDINRYGTTAWAISQLVEQAGIQTRIWYVTQGIGNGTQGSDNDVWVKLKDAGQYLAPSLLAAAFTTRFYRRMMFAMYTLAAEVTDQAVTSGLGSMPHYGYRVKYEPGKLLLAPEIYRGFDANCEQEILKAIGADKRKSA